MLQAKIVRGLLAPSYIFLRMEIFEGTKQQVPYALMMEKVPVTDT